MIKTILVLWLQVFAMSIIVAQPFEGKITYQIDVVMHQKDHPNADYLESRWGDQVEIHHDKNANQRRDFNSVNGFEYQLYSNKKNFYYVKYVGYDTLYYYDCSTSLNTFVSIEAGPTKEILDYKCESIILKEVSGFNNDTITSTLYYSPKLELNWEKYINFKDSSVDKIYGYCKSHLLEWEIDQPTLKVKYSAIKIEKYRPKKKIFKVPKSINLKQT